MKNIRLTHIFKIYRFYRFVRNDDDHFYCRIRSHVDKHATKISAKHCLILKLKYLNIYVTNLLDENAFEWNGASSMEDKRKNKYKLVSEGR